MTDREQCPVCPAEVAVSVKGTLRRHPKGAEDPCPGSGYPVRGEQEAAPPVPAAAHGPTTTEPVAEPTAVVREPQRLAPGVYRSAEPMLDPKTLCPSGYVTVAVIMHVPYDGSNGRSPREEATMLFDDPGYLARVIDATPNDRIRISMKVG